MSSNINLRNINSEDKWQLLTWRNQDYIRSVSANSDVIEADAHSKWFESKIGDRTKPVLICEWDNQPVGVIQIETWDPSSRTGSWGCYLGELNVHPGLGAALVVLGGAFGFLALDATEMNAYVLSHNSNMLGIHRRLNIPIVETKALPVSNSRSIELDAIEFQITREQWPDILNRALELFPSAFRNSLSSCLELLPSFYRVDA